MDPVALVHPQSSIVMSSIPPLEIPGYLLQVPANESPEDKAQCEGMIWNMWEFHTKKVRDEQECLRREEEAQKLQEEEEGKKREEEERQKQEETDRKKQEAEEAEWKRQMEGNKKQR